METRLHTKNFENLLKDHADQFKMTPSKKVWHGIYNDLHPGRRWPSIAMSLVFLFTLVIIGHLNTNNGYKNTVVFNLPGQDLKNVNASQNKNESGWQTSKHLRQNKTGDNFVADIITESENTKDAKQDAVFIATNNTPDNNTLSQNISLNNEPVSVNNALPVAQTVSTNHSVTRTTLQTAQTGNEKDLRNNTDKTTDVKNPDLPQTTELKNSLSSVLLKDKKNVEKKVETLNKDIVKTESQQASIPKFFKKNRNKIRWVYYITPSVSYRKLSGSELTNPAIAAAIAAPYQQISNTSINSSVADHAALGFETGGELTYKISKRLLFTTGIQFNYSRYSITANNIHPVEAILLLNSENIDRPYVVTAASQYGNGTGPAKVTLHNYSVQASAPIGLQYKFASSGNLEFNIAGSFQPSFVIADKSYILSTDKRNYITQPSLSRKWNMGTNFGTFVSFRTNSFTWQIGPQVHYQILSTYNANYPIKEHLIDYGVRFGISKNLK